MQDDKDNYMVLIKGFYFCLSNRRYISLFFSKGAAEQLVDRCKTYLNADGKDEELDDKTKQTVLVQQEILCDVGERVLALCRMYVPKSQYSIPPFLRLSLLRTPHS